MATDEELRAHLEERELARQAELEAVEAGTGAATAASPTLSPRTNRRVACVADAANRLFRMRMGDRRVPVTAHGLLPHPDDERAHCVHVGGFPASTTTGDLVRAPSRAHSSALGGGLSFLELAAADELVIPRCRRRPLRGAADPPSPADGWTETRREASSGSSGASA